MLQEDQVTWAPRAVSVSIKTAVCTVMWRQPAILQPESGLEWAYLARRDMRPGISFSAIWMAFLPESARVMSATPKFGMILVEVAVAVAVAVTVVAIFILSRGWAGVFNKNILVQG